METTNIGSYTDKFYYNMEQRNRVQSTKSEGEMNQQEKKF